MRIRVTIPVYGSVCTGSRYRKSFLGGILYRIPVQTVPITGVETGEIASSPYRYTVTFIDLPSQSSMNVLASHWIEVIMGLANPSKIKTLFLEIRNP